LKFGHWSLLVSYAAGSIHCLGALVGPLSGFKASQANVPTEIADRDAVELEEYDAVIADGPRTVPHGLA